MDTSIKVKADKILELLRSDEKSSYYSGILILLVVLFLGVIFAHYIKFGFSYKLIMGILILFIILLLYRMKMLSSFRFSSELNDYSSFKETDQTQYLSGYLNFLESGVEIKQVRVNYIKYLYILVFPLFLYLLSELLNGLYGGKAHFWALLFAFIISGLAFHFCFAADAEDWEVVNDDVQDLKAKLHL